MSQPFAMPACCGDPLDRTVRSRPWFNGRTDDGLSMWRNGSRLVVRANAAAVAARLDACRANLFAAALYQRGHRHRLARLFSSSAHFAPPACHRRSGDGSTTAAALTLARDEAVAPGIGYQRPRSAHSSRSRPLLLRQRESAVLPFMGPARTTSLAATPS